MFGKKLIEVLNELMIEPIDRKDITKIGEGAWHRVYRLKRALKPDLAIRVKKKVAYDQVQVYIEEELRTEYESTKVYYQYANTVSEKVCPTHFQYYLNSSLVFTVETYMGKGRNISSLSEKEALSAGGRLGKFFRDMHHMNLDITGFGRLKWNGENLEGEAQQEVNKLWQKDNDFYLEVLEKLIATDLSFDKELVVSEITKIIEKRREKPQQVALVNQDITPENFIVNGNQISVIDPFPRLDFNIKYAGFFVFCYKFLLPAYSDAPRYRKNLYRENVSTLQRIGEGFIEGYTSGNKEMKARIHDESILWVLLETYEHIELLKVKNPSNKTLQQMGNSEVVKNRLSVCLKELEESCLALIREK